VPTIIGVNTVCSSLTSPNGGGSAAAFSVATQTGIAYTWSCTGCNPSTGTGASFTTNLIPLSFGEALGVGLFATNLYGTVSVFKTVAVINCTTPTVIGICPQGTKAIGRFTFELIRDTLFLQSTSEGRVHYHSWKVADALYNFTPYVKYPITNLDKIKDTIPVTLIVTDFDGCRDTVSQLIVYSARLTGLDNLTPCFACIGLKIFPNPATDELIITTAHKGILSIYDLQGILLIQLNIQTEVQKLDISSLNFGMYLYQFISKESTAHGTILKQ